MGVAQTFGGVARATAPVMATTVFQDFGHRWPFLMAAAIVGVVSLLAFRVGPDSAAADMAPVETPVPQ